MNGGERTGKWRIGLAQIDCALGEVDQNLDKVHSIVAQYGSQADLLVFPELTLTGYSVGERAYETALRIEDPRFQRLQAASADTTIAVGFIEETKSYRFFNSLAFLQRGELVQTHRKINLPNYGIFEERKYFSVGPRYRCVNLDGVLIGPFVCGDAWSPPLAHLAAAEGADIFVVSVCSPSGGLGGELSSEKGWLLACHFYAVMYGVYVVFVNRIGKERDLSFWGSSQIIDPFGQVVASASDSEEDVVVAEIDLSRVRRARTKLHTVRDDDLGFHQRHLSRLIDQKDYL